MIKKGSILFVTSLFIFSSCKKENLDVVDDTNNNYDQFESGKKLKSSRQIISINGNGDDDDDGDLEDTGRK